MRATQCLHLLKCMKTRLRIVTQSASVVVNDVREARHGFPDFEQLVDLFLILNDREIDAGVFQHIGHIGRRGVLIQGNSDATQTLSSGHRPVQTRTVVANYREIHAAFETQRRESAGELADMFGGLRPAGRLPDTQIFFPERRLVGAYLRVLKQ